MLDILCVGDSVIDIFIKIPHDDPKFGLDKQNNKLFFNYGDKISIEKYIIGIGGNATNASVSASKLGIKSGLLAEIGNDEFSDKITNHLKNEGVNLDFLLKDADKQTSITIALSYMDDRTLFTEHIERKHNFNLNLLNSKLVYLTSLGNVWEKAYENVIEHIKKTKNILAFNPGSLQIENKNRVVLDAIEYTDYLIVNKQEAEEILYGKQLGIKIENDKKLIKKLLFGLKSLGAKNIIITDSNNGSYLFDKYNNSYHLGIVKVEVVEKTGAGDAYSAGFLSAILKGLDEKEAMVWGAINSSNVITKVGAQNGLLTENELIKIKSSLTNYFPQEL